MKSSKYPANLLVNRVGKYLYKNLSGAVDNQQGANMYDVYTLVLYQDPEYRSDMQEMVIDINITTYQNKIRVNTIQTSPNQKTLGYDLFDSSVFEDIRYGCELVYSKVCRRIVKEYKDYKFLF